MGRPRGANGLRMCGWLKGSEGPCVATSVMVDTTQLETALLREKRGVVEALAAGGPAVPKLEFVGALVGLVMLGARRSSMGISSHPGAPICACDAVRRGMELNGSAKEDLWAAGSKAPNMSLRCRRCGGSVKELSPSLSEALGDSPLPSVCEAVRTDLLVLIAG